MHLLLGCKPPCDHTCGPEPQQERGERGTVPLTAVSHAHQHGDRCSVCLQTLAGKERAAVNVLWGSRLPPLVSPGKAPSVSPDWGCGTEEWQGPS